MPDRTAMRVRLAAAAGVAHLLFLVAFTAVGAGVGPIDFASSSDAEIRDLFSAHGGQLSGMVILIQMAAVALIVFSVGLWRAVRVAESEPRWLSALVPICGVGAALGMVAWAALWAVAIHLVDEVPGEIDRFTLHAMWDLSLTSALLVDGAVLSVFYGATALVALDTGVLPRPLAWTSGALAILFVIGIVLEPAGVVGFMLSALWNAGAGVVLFRRARPADDLAR